MNKLLRQFEKESKLEIYGLGAKRIPWEAALEKYAELIIRECITQCEKNAEHSYLGPGSKLSAFNIKEHFGIEE
jgi:hypothetical protein